MTDNLKLWDALSKTDPRHTKQFSRAGGFKGTAIKPIWIVQRLTDLFGPVGKGWGMGAPSFQVVNATDETLVYCTVECWHTDRANTFYGVGGDKVVTKRQSGSFNDDEAFKKAFTDAVGNAFKFLGVGADVHMGQFDDSKYVREVAQEFAASEGQGQSQDGAVSPARITKEQADALLALATEVGADLEKFCGYYKIGALPELQATDLAHATSALESKRKKAA